MKIKELATILAMAAAVALTPGVAHADPPPTDCHVGASAEVNWVFAYCFRGTGFVRAVAYCGTKKRQVLGPWKPVPTPAGQDSIAKCKNTEAVYGIDYDIKTY
ncbi:hypothetical protein [Nonomuraea sp. NPDC050202]|uniref:hypothetical protein n=1 Tax=Nonomuraea sp. NPDC050202 TaxID=3155035 RepID=UPI0033E3B174